MSNHQAPLRQQKGYSIIELSIALAIISIILVTALAGVQRILRSNNVNSDLRGLNLTAANLATLYSSQPDTSVVAMPTLVDLRAFDGFAVNNVANTVANAFGGQITVATNTVAIDGFPANSGFMIYSTNIPSEACPDYISGLNNIAPNITTTNAVAPAVAGAVYGTAVRANNDRLVLATVATACAVAPATPKIAIAAFIPKS
jgi:prepilin-type N-terminal cleavage/methylation domain-containing protein